MTPSNDPPLEDVRTSDNMAPAEVESDNELVTILHAAERAGRLTSPIRILEDQELIAPILSEDDGSLDAAVLTPSIRGFTLLSDFWHGGQACVFKAIQQSTQRVVAIKVITGGSFISSNQRARFDLETKLLSKIDHPNVVKIVDRGRTTDGSFYFAMDFIEGVSLEEYWKTVLWPDPDGLQKLLKLFIDLLEIFDFVHERDIVHRDIKPSNIRIDQFGGLHVLDFGLARLFEEDASEARKQLTVSGQLIGSISWASPEHIASTRSVKVDERSDIYALGLVLYKALSGRFPYNTNGTLPEVAHQIVKARPLVPSRAPKESIAWANQLDPTLDDIVLKALAKSQHHRYASATEFRTALQSYLDGKRNPLLRPGRLISLLATMATIAVIAIMAITHMKAKMPLARTSVIVLPSMTNGVGMTLVKIPWGTFLMGSTPAEFGHQDNERLHSVALSHDFYLATMEVTRKQYRALMPLAGSLTQETDDLPVDGITYEDAVEFCRRLSTQEKRNYRLPTLEEWEYACRAGTVTVFNGSGDLETDGWYAGNSGHRLHSVGLKLPNTWGLYDMHGNVAEWCFQRSPTTVPAPNDLLSDPSNLAPVAGGSADDPEEYCRSASHINEVRYTGPLMCGFRVAADVH